MSCQFGSQKIQSNCKTERKDEKRHKGSTDVFFFCHKSRKSAYPSTSKQFQALAVESQAVIMLSHKKEADLVENYSREPLVQS